MKIRILRGITIAEPPHHKAGEGEPPTFGLGDVVEVSRALGQELIGNSKAELVEPDEPEGKAEAPVEGATAEPPENAAEKAVSHRKAAGSAGDED